MKLPLLHIQVEQVIRLRHEKVAAAVGNSFALSPPFGGPVWILDRSRNALRFQTSDVLPGPLFRQAGELELIEQGVKTRVRFSMDLTGLLVLCYSLHLIPAFLLWMVQGIWARLIDPGIIGLVQYWMLLLLLFWPAALYLILRLRMKQRIKTFVHNLVFYSG